MRHYASIGAHGNRNPALVGAGNTLAVDLDGLACFTDTIFGHRTGGFGNFYHSERR